MGGESERQELDAIVASGERSRGEAEEAEDVDDVLCGGGERRRAEVEGGDRCDGRRGMTLRGSMMGVGSWHLFLALFAALMGTASSQLTPIIESVSDVTMKACPNAECAPVNVQITVGHQDAAFPLNTLTMTWQPEPPLNDAFSPISTITSVIGDGAQRVIALKANGKIFGSSIISLTLRDTNPVCTIGCSATISFSVIVQPLSPVFDAFGPTRTVVDFKTMVGTPTYPYTFLVGHEDDAKLSDLIITASSLNPDILPNICCNPDILDCNTNPCCAAYCTGASSFAGDDNNAAAGGIKIQLHPYNQAEELSFVVGEFVVKAMRVTITLRPSASTPGPATLSFRLSDGPIGTAAITQLQTVKVNVFGRPTMDKFCAYDVKAEESLQSIADIYGMHWMTVFMFNNHTLPHPDSLVPGSRISIGRPYIVRDGDSLYSIATKYGTTWQQIKALNPAIILDEKSLFVGQLLCIAPDLAFVNCRNRY